MTTAHEKLTLKLQLMMENDLTKNVIIPVLNKLGFIKVEFHGGTSEEGKDIICWERDNLDNIRVIVSQVKHFKLTKIASDSKSLNTIVNQLSQCFTKRIPYQDKTFYTPYEAYLITTYPVDTGVLLSRFSEYPVLVDRKINIIDSTKLVELIFKHKPDLAKKLIGDNFYN